MSKFIYPIDSQILDGITRGIEHFKNIGPAPTPPTVAQLKELLDCAFAASVETEEGRTVAFTLAFFEDRDSHFPYRMKQPLSLSPRNLVHLAVALDPSRTRICIVANEKGLQIAGIIHLGEQDAFHGTGLSLSHLSIRVLGPAILCVRYNGFLLLTYRRGRFTLPAEESTLLHEHNVQRALSFLTLAGRRVDELKSDLRFEHALVRIVRTMLRLGHGGTLLIVPNGTEWEPHTQSNRFMPNTPSTSVKTANDQRLDHETKRNQAIQQVMTGQVSTEIVMYLADDMIRSGFFIELEWLARLTATDGMTVIQPDFTVLGFGVFFTTKEEAGNTTQVVVIDPYEDTTNLKPRDLEGGARHQSAAITCRCIPGATAIVVSQDGSLSSMKWDPVEKAVTQFRHLELLLDI